MAKAPSPAAKKSNDHFERYGLIWDRREVNDLSLELACYRDPLRYKTGQPREFHMRKAFDIVWPEFKWNDWCELMMWAWCNYKIIIVLGCSRGGKTFYFAHLALLDYLANDSVTATTFTTTKFDLLKTRMWGDMMMAIANMRPEVKQGFMQRYRIHSTTNEMRLTVNHPPSEVKDHSRDKFMIQGVATDSADTAAGKIRGQHADRRRILGDEAQDIAAAIYVAIGNAISAPDFRTVLLSNPVEKISDFGNWAEPKDGWQSVSENDLFWETKTPNGVCLHLDGLKSPNVMAGKTVFPYLITQEYIDFIREKFGENSLEWWMFVRGFFPPDGVVARVWPSGTITKAMPTQEFDFIPMPVASLDPAYESDDCVLTFASLGKRRDGNPLCVIRRQVKIKTQEGPNLPTKDKQIADQVMALCKSEGVAPENYIQDTTGNGRSVFALLHLMWSQKIQKIEYGGAATNRPLRHNDPKPANELVKWFVAELWFRASYLAHDGIICGLKNADPKCLDDLATRRYFLKQGDEGKLMIVEKKEEMKVRLGRSPDYADSLVGLGELISRKGYLSDVKSSSTKDQWEAARARARKASQKFTEEFQPQGTFI